jgi:hypothetical protein
MKVKQNHPWRRGNALTCKNKRLVAEQEKKREPVVEEKAPE